MKAHSVDELATRIANAERGMFDDEADVARAAADADGEPTGKH